MTTTDSPAPGTTRRQLLRTGTVGAAAAAFLAACGTTDESVAGESGVPPQDDEVTPTVPIPEPNSSDLEYNATLMRTAISLELLAVEVYSTYGADLEDATASADAERYAADHEAAAAEFADALPLNLQVDEPNQVMQERFVDPLAAELVDDASILAFFDTLESTLAATYVVAVGDYFPEDSSDESRDLFARHAAAAGRRVTVLGNGGTGSVPQNALFDTVDLIPNAAYVLVNEPVAEPAADAEATDGEGS